MRKASSSAMGYGGQVAVARLRLKRLRRGLRFAPIKACLKGRICVKFHRGLVFTATL
jgi:hypothetical protein